MDAKGQTEELLEDHAGTCSRWGQRAICSVAAQNQWAIWTIDISIAFLRGKTFQDIAEKIGMNVRSTQVALPYDSNTLVKQCEGFENFDEITETLDMVKPGLGTNDAPWAWQMELDDAHGLAV